MARKTKHRRWSWRRQAASWSAAATLAAWRWRTQRLLLLVAGLGIVVAVVLISSLPLFSNVMATAGVRGVLRAQSNSSQVLVNASLRGISSDLAEEATSQANSLVQQDAGRYLPNPPQTTIITGNWQSLLPVDFFGVPIQTVRSHLHLFAGHLPAAHASNASNIDIMLTRSAALYLGNLKVGATIPLFTQLLPAPNDVLDAYNNTVSVHVVGIFQVNPDDAYWDGYTLEEPPSVSGSPPPPVLALTDQASLLHMLDAIVTQHNALVTQHNLLVAQHKAFTTLPSAQGIFFQDKSETAFLSSYTLNTSIITNNNLTDVITRLGALQQDISQQFLSGVNVLNMNALTLSGPPVHDSARGAGGDSTLEKYRSQVEITRTPGLILTAEIFCLILLFVSVTLSVLVEREQMAIAVLRSRGANRSQVFGSLFTEGLALCLLAALIGPVLAIALVSVTAPHILPANTQDALNELSLDAAATFHSLLLYTLVALAAAFLVLLLTIFLAVRANILVQRREEARATRLPFWQRLRLDLVVAALTIGGYALILVLENSQQLLSAQSQTLVSTPLGLLAPLLLIIAGILLFLRLFPLLLRWLARRAQRRRGLALMLALAQIERSPRQPLRMTLLLGLATAFVLFSLVFAASQGQRAQDLAAYQTVSDFSGYNLNLPATTSANASTIIDQTTARYQRIKGVTSASVGSMLGVYLLVSDGVNHSYAWSTQLLAVDADTFAQTALWTSQDSSQPLSQLMKLLVSQRSQAREHGLVPALVAANTWRSLQLNPGATFHLTGEGGAPDPTTYLAVAEVDHIPPVDDGTQGALLVDYQSLVIGQTQAQAQELAQPNYVWLRTSSSAAELKGIRTTLNDANSPLYLATLLDRRELGGASATDPLANGLISILSIGVATALLLALLANLILPLVSLRMRQTNFAVLRALGTDPEQVRHILIWELATVLAASLLLGLVFGALLAMTAVPSLVFSGALPASLVSISSNAIYTLQQVVPVRVILPPSLLPALLVLLALCALTLGLLTRLAQRPLLAQALRLNED